MDAAACAIGGASGLGREMTGAGGRGTDCGVMKRGAGLGSAGATGCALAATGAVEGAGLGGTAAGGAAVIRETVGVERLGGAAGRAGVAGCAARWVIAFSTSPGLEMCDRSILGLNSSCPGAAAREPRERLGSCSAKYFFTRSASSSSIELECVFFSVTPTLGRTSRIALLLTSSSLARSLIRILCSIPPRFLRYVPLPGSPMSAALALGGVVSGYAFIASSRFNSQWPVASGQLRISVGFH